MKQVFHRPANNWHEGFPLGNGRLGAVMHCGADKEVLSLNEDSLWSGYPYDESFKGFSKKCCEEAAKLCREGKYAEAMDQIESEGKEASDVQMYVPFGDIVFDFIGQREVEDYRRELDLSQAVASFSYSRQGARYRHSCFISAVAQALIYRITAEECFSLMVSVQGGFVQNTSYLPGGFLAKGECPGRMDRDSFNAKAAKFSEKPEERGMRFAGLGRIITDGTCRPKEQGLLIENAREVTLHFALRSSFCGFHRHPFTQGSNETELVKEDLDRISGTAYSQLLESHVSDYRRYFDRISLDLGPDEDAELDIDLRLKKAMTGENNPAFAALLFDFGRYLLICCSRQGTQAANLQGLWNSEKFPPWFCDYTVNINTQMNYWPTGPCNLDELSEPLLRLNQELLINGASTAKAMGGNGSACYHNTDIWRKTSPATGQASWAFWPFGGAWMCRNLYETYLFSEDIEYLQRLLPVLKENASFCASMLQETSQGLAICPATSPENEFISRDNRPAPAAVYSENTMAIVRNLFRDYAEACRTLDYAEEASRYEDILSRLVSPQIGAHGQIMEWSEELVECDVHHRHLSNLYELHPGRGITPREKELYEAARVTLERRGDEGTGWSLAWKLLMWARMEDGERFCSVLSRLFRLVDPDNGGTMMGGGLYANLFCAHPPFQIDGNFGYVAGVAEALLQSHNDEIVILPALPPVWKSGEVRGLRARGNIVCDISWSPNKTKYRIVSGRGKTVQLRAGGRIENVELKPGVAYTGEF